MLREVSGKRQAPRFVWELRAVNVLYSYSMLNGITTYFRLKLTTFLKLNKPCKKQRSNNKTKPLFWDPLIKSNKSFLGCELIIKPE